MEGKPAMARLVLTDDQWRRLEPLLPQRRTGGRPYGTDHRTTVEGILWIARTGAPWRDLPPEFGKWITVYQRFRRWTERGVFQRVFDSLASDLDMSVAMVDGTFVKVHQHATGARKEEALPTSPDSGRPSGLAVEGLPRS